MAFDIERGFNIGQKIGGTSATGEFVKQLTERAKQIQEVAAQSQLPTQQLAAEQTRILRESPGLGIGLSPEGAPVVSPGGVNAPAGFAGNNPYRETSNTIKYDEQGRPSLSQTTKDVDPIAGDTAAKATMAINAKEQVGKIRSILFPEGNINSYRKDLVLRESIPFNLGSKFSGSPFAKTQEGKKKLQDDLIKSQDLDFLFEDAANARLRIETGATAKDNELNSVINRFKPKFTDTPQTVVNKLENFEKFLSTAEILMDPTGRYATILGKRIRIYPVESMPLNDQGIPEGAEVIQ